MNPCEHFAWSCAYFLRSPSLSKRRLDDKVNPAMSQQRRQLKIGSRETGEIDRGLSRLRKIIKGLETDLATFHDEFDVLLKVWYRGKNQHRQSLHWRKLSGVGLAMSESKAYTD